MASKLRVKTCCYDEYIQLFEITYVLDEPSIIRSMLSGVEEIRVAIEPPSRPAANLIATRDLQSQSHRCDPLPQPLVPAAIEPPSRSPISSRPAAFSDKGIDDTNLTFGPVEG
ncbi:hypothetical protein ACS0TY_022517 [Phlomoides rotata]